MIESFDRLEKGQSDSETDRQPDRYTVKQTDRHIHPTGNYQRFTEFDNKVSNSISIRDHRSFSLMLLHNLWRTSLLLTSDFSHQ